MVRVQPEVLGEGDVLGARTTPFARRVMS